MNLDSSKLGFEDEILDYLSVHGNTKKCDLIEFCTCNLNLTSESAEKRLDKMFKEGWIGHIIHNKLKISAVYVSLSWIRPLNSKKEDKKALREEVRKILEEARIVAEQRMKQKSSDRTR